MRNRGIAWAVVVVLWLVWPMVGEATPVAYLFTKIADTAGPFSSFRGTPTINDHGRVAFCADVDYGLGGEEGIFVGNGSETVLGHYTRIVDDSGPFSLGFNGYPAINNVGQVVFTGGGVGMFDPGMIAEGIFIGTGGGTSIGDFTLIARAKGPAPGGSAGVFGRLSHLGHGINDHGQVAFETSSGVFVGVGGEVEMGDYTKIGNAVSFSDGRPDITNSGIVVYGDDEGIHVGSSGPPTDIVTPSMVLTGFGTRPAIKSEGWATPGPAVVYLADTSVERGGIFAGPGYSVADTTDPFASFLYAPDINNSGRVAFVGLAEKPEGGLAKGVFTGADPARDKVIATGDMLFGSEVVSVNFGRGLNEHGQIAFIYQTTSPSRWGIAVATPIYGSTLMPAFLIGQEPVLWGRGMARANVVPAQAGTLTFVAHQHYMSLVSGNPEIAEFDQVTPELTPDVRIAPGMPEPQSAMVASWAQAAPSEALVIGWDYVYDEDPDLTDTVLEFSLFPPEGILDVSVELIDADGCSRGWFATGLPHEMREYSIRPDLAAAQPPFDSFLNEPRFDITKVVAIRLGGASAGRAATPDPTGKGDMWSGWGHVGVRVIPEPSTLALVLLGLGLLGRRRRGCRRNRAGRPGAR